MRYCFFLLIFTLCGWAQIQAQAPSAPSSANTEELLPEDADVFFMRDGSQRVGRLIGVDENQFRLQRQVLPGQAAATISMPRDQIERVVFASSADREQFLAAGESADVLLAARYWGAGERYLDLPRSPSAQVGLVYASLLLGSGNPATRERALEIYRLIEDKAWSPEDRATARRGRLRALIATGRAQEAIAEAEELAHSSEDPAVLIEARYILATASATQLREIEEANPRWEEDRFIRPERIRLYNEALDRFLYPVLFHGSVIEPSARGLWAVIELYQDGSEVPAALEVARDLLSLYPETPEAEKARTFISQLPAEITQYDQENEARQRLDNLE